MLLNNFFYINDFTHQDPLIVANIQINTGHEILKGHFPRQPVVPGVCVLEMLKETLQEAFSKKLQLQESSVIKFLVMFAPPVYTHAQFDITYKIPAQDQFSIEAVLKQEEIIFFKFKGLYRGK